MQEIKWDEIWSKFYNECTYEDGHHHHLTFNDPKLVFDFFKDYLNKEEPKKDLSEITEEHMYEAAIIFGYSEEEAKILYKKDFLENIKYAISQDYLNGNSIYKLITFLSKNYNI